MINFGHAACKKVCQGLTFSTWCIQLNILASPINKIACRDYRAGAGTRIASIMGGKKVLMMANHGVLIATETIAEAFDFMYYVERAAEVTVKALSSGRPLKPIRDEVCKMTHDKFVVSGVAKVRTFRQTPLSTVSASRCILKPDPFIRLSTQIFSIGLLLCPKENVLLGNCCIVVQA